MPLSNTLPGYRKLAIMQPYFFPYLGFFQLMAKADKFVLYDDVNFINRGWINRNRIKLNGAAHLITVPLHDASQNKLICEIQISQDAVWKKKMLKTIAQAYARAGCFDPAFRLVEEIIAYPSNDLAAFLRNSLFKLRDYLGIETEIVESSRTYGNASLNGEARIVDICVREHAGVYINAIGGMDLYARNEFADKGLELYFVKPTLDRYAQDKTEFLPGLSIIDVIMHNDRPALRNMLDSGVLL